MTSNFVCFLLTYYNNQDLNRTTGCNDGPHKQPTYFNGVPHFVPLFLPFPVFVSHPSKNLVFFLRVINIKVFLYMYWLDHSFSCLSMNVSLCFPTYSYCYIFLYSAFKNFQFFAISNVLEGVFCLL